MQNLFFLFYYLYLGIKWKQVGATVAGGNDPGNRLNQLYCPADIFLDDDQNIYIADWWNHRIVEWKCNATNGQIVAGGNGKGTHLNQLDSPTGIFVDADYSMYVSDENNHRVMKWTKNAKEGVVVAGGNGDGNSLV